MPISRHHMSTIMKRAIAHRFTPISHQLQRERADLLERIRSEMFTPEQIKAIEALGPAHMDSCAGFRTHGGFKNGSRVSIIIPYEYGGDVCPIAEEKLRRLLVPNSFHYNCGVDSSQETLDLIDAFNKRTRDFARDKEAAELSLHNYLVGFKNLAALVKAWPEGEPFYRGLDAPAVTRLPAVQTEAINKLFELPIDETPEPDERQPLDASLAAAVSG